MIDGYVIAMEGLAEKLKGIEDIPEDLRLNAVRAINKTADRAIANAKRRMRRQVNFTPGYLNDRIAISKKATRYSLEARITARHRATSLARFETAVTKGGVTVMVKPGAARRIPRSFIMKLRGSGGDLTNRGLAVRTTGPAPKGSFKPVKVANGLWLLYGPSVDQVLRGTIPEMTEETAEQLEAEFWRLQRVNF